MDRRYAIAREILERGDFFKIVCGAGNEDPEEVKRLAFIYTLAGTAAMDVSANPEIVRSAADGITLAENMAGKLGTGLRHRPFITVSVGLKGDPHVRKARINADLCERCGLCITACEQDAIDESFTVISPRCIGCGKCAEACTAGAVEFTHKKVDLADVIPGCLSAGAEMVELHAVTVDDDSVRRDWNLVSSLVTDNFISMCLDRSVLSDNHLRERVAMAFGIAGDRLIIQADGAPMSGGSDDYHTTLQAVATADIVRKTGIPAMILASGGTNAKTMELARLCGVTVNGVSVGTYARRIIKEHLGRPDFWSDLSVIQAAAGIARELVRVNTRCRE